CPRLSAFVLLSSSYGAHRPPHSFPTRRSSDLFHPLRHTRIADLCQRYRFGRRRDHHGELAVQLHHHHLGVVTLQDTSAIRRFGGDRKSTRLNSSHVKISYAVFCLKKKKRAKRD